MPAAAHPISCRCGALAGTLAPSAWTNRLVCYCDDCQAFARYLDREDEVLDLRGGSDIVQTGPRYLSFTRGHDQLACLRLSPRGLLRWYASCCGTPIGNTPANPRFAFVGLLHVALGDPAGLDPAFGPPRMTVHTRFARGEPQPESVVSLPRIALMMARVSAARLSGRYRQTPFFTADGSPVAAPAVVSAPPPAA